MHDQSYEGYPACQFWLLKFYWLVRIQQIHASIDWLESASMFMCGATSLSINVEITHSLILFEIPIYFILVLWRTRKFVYQGPK